MIARLKKGAAAVLEFLETLVLCVVIAIALAVGAVESAANTTDGEEEFNPLCPNPTKKRNTP